MPALSMKRHHFVEKREFLPKSAISWKNGGFCRVCPPESAISWRKMRQRKSDITSEREFLVCVYWSVAMGIYLMICSEVTVCIPSVADASYGGSVGNATF